MKMFLGIFFLLGSTVCTTDLFRSPAEDLKNTVEYTEKPHNSDPNLPKSEISNDESTIAFSRLSNSTTSSSAVKTQEYIIDDESKNSVPPGTKRATVSPEDDGQTLVNRQVIGKKTGTKKKSSGKSKQRQTSKNPTEDSKPQTGKETKFPETTNLDYKNESIEVMKNGENLTNPDCKNVSTEVIKKEENLTLSTESTPLSTEEPIKKDNITTHEETLTPVCSVEWNECSRKDDTVTEVAKDMMTFTLNLFKLLTKSNRKPNLIVSPISVAMALSHLMLGADGETKALMLKTLYDGVRDVHCIPEAMQNLTTQDSFLSASEIFYNKELHIHEEFINRSARFYKSKGIQLPKDNTESLEKINSWVSQRTNNLIPALLQELPPDLQLILLNIIHYQGKWLSKFDPSLTKKEDFRRLSSGSGPVKVPLMFAQKYPLQMMKDKHLNAQVARFPLSDNCSLLIFLPNEHTKNALTKMETELNQEIVNLLLTQLEEVPVRPTSVFLPQLKLDSSIGLNDALSSLGLADLYDYPNLCGLSNSTDLAVSEVHHHAFLEIKEEGVKAAAASAVTIARTITVFSVRRPFLFMLVSDINRLPILIGHVNDPSQ